MSSKNRNKAERNDLGKGIPTASELRAQEARQQELNIMAGNPFAEENKKAREQALLIYALNVAEAWESVARETIEKQLRPNAGRPRNDNGDGVRRLEKYYLSHSKTSYPNYLSWHKRLFKEKPYGLTAYHQHMKTIKQSLKKD